MNSTMTTTTGVISPATIDNTYVVNPSTGTNHWISPRPEPVLTISWQAVECPDHTAHYSLSMAQADGKAVHFCPDCLLTRLKLLVPSYEVR